MKFASFLTMRLATCFAGCAPSAYHPAPVAPQAIAAQLEARSLDDPLRAWMRRATGFEPATWPLAT